MEKPSYKGENPFTNAIKQVVEIEINEMKTEIKKALYKQKPKAILQFIRLGIAYYQTPNIEVDGEQMVVKFEVPVSDMGEADFFPEMDAKLLNRWIVVVDL